MKARQRIALLARAYPDLFSLRELSHLVKSQLGSLDALDEWSVNKGIRTRARAPRIIHHVCAGNLAVSAITSLAHGLILGSHNTVKLPSPRDDDQTRREIIAFVDGLPKALRSLVELHDQHDAPSFARAEVIVAFGNDATMQALRAQTRVDQRFIAHGHAVSLLWIGDSEGLTPRQARSCAVDVLTYDQLGCLSPQAIYFPRRARVGEIGRQLASGLETEWARLDQKPRRSLGARARIAEARDVARALGHQLWIPRNGHLSWTIIYEPDPSFAPSPLHGVIYLRASTTRDLANHLEVIRGKLSTVGMVGEMAPRSRKIFLGLGATRFCLAGRMQFPPLGWHHDGRGALTELVTWIDDEGA